MYVLRPPVKLVLDGCLSAWQAPVFYGKCGKGDSFGLAQAGFDMEAVTDQALTVIEQPLPAPLLGSQPMRQPKVERFCRLRALLRPKADAYRQSGFASKSDHDAIGNASRLERRHDVQERIAYLTRGDEELLREKQKRIEEMLWLIHESNVADLWKTIEVEKRDKSGKLLLDAAGKPIMVRRQIPKPLDELPEDVQRVVEKLDEKGQPQLYSKLQANAELRKLLGIGAVTRDDGDMGRLSDAELVAQLAAQARELGIDIDLSYRFRE